MACSRMSGSTHAFQTHPALHAFASGVETHHKFTFVKRKIMICVFFFKVDAKLSRDC